MMQQYATKFPAEAAQYTAAQKGQLPENWKEKLPRNKDSIATRKASENALAALVPAIPFLVGGSADLTHSVLTMPASAKMIDFQPGSYHGRYFRFGVREHAMCGVMNGIDAHGGLIPYGGTFLNFIGYAMGSVRLAAMSEHHVVYVMTHDSIGLGEDGPTHQPIEIVAALRATPNLHVFRPSDQTETSASWAIAIEEKKTPSVLCLTRQNTRPMAASSFDGVAKGAYAILDVEDPQVILIGTGSEVEICFDAAKLLQPLRVRVVSMPCWSLFEKQPEDYRRKLLPRSVPTVSVEVYHPLGWERYSHDHVGMTTFGASAPAKTLYQRFGFTAVNVAARAKKVLEKFGSAKL
jgi:transketolase